MSDKTAIVGPLLDLMGAGIPSIIGSSIGARANTTDDERFKALSDQYKFHWGKGMLIPGYLGYHQGRKTRAYTDGINDLWNGKTQIVKTDHTKESSHEATRLKKPNRGWYVDKSPGFHDLKGKFEDAARKGLGKEVKLANEQVAAIRDALAKFGFLRSEKGEDDPVGVLTHVLRNSGFGFKLPARDAHVVGMKPKQMGFGGPAPIESGDAASRQMSFGLGGSGGQGDYTGV
jgi:hypothetical protein